MSFGISSRGIAGIRRAGAAKCHVRRKGRVYRVDGGRLERDMFSRRTSPNDRIPDIDEMKRAETNVLEYAATLAARYRQDTGRNHGTLYPSSQMSFHANAI